MTECPPHNHQHPDCAAGCPRWDHEHGNPWHTQGQTPAPIRYDQFSPAWTKESVCKFAEDYACQRLAEIKKELESEKTGRAFAKSDIQVLRARAEAAESKLTPAQAELQRMREALGDLVELAAVAMRLANRDGAEYDVDEELAASREALRTQGGESKQS